MSLTYKQRQETKTIVLVHKDYNNNTYQQLYRKCRQEGNFDTGYHYFIDRIGRLTADREETAVAGWDLDNNTSSLYVLIDTPNGKLTDSQNFELSDLLEQFKTKYPEATIINK